MCFAVVWYLCLSSVSWVVYRYYLPWDHASAFITDDDLLWRLGGACGIYLVVEILYYLAFLTSRDEPRGERNTDETHVIIAAHRAAQSLRDTLPAVLQTFPASRVWVADNGFEDTDTAALCLELGVRYRFLAPPNKTFALYSVAKEIHETDKSVRNVVLLDDDTLLPPTFFIRHDLLSEPLVAGYCVAITIQRNPPWNLWEQLIDFEYRSISYRNGSKSTIAFVHGICAVYRLSRMLMIYSKLCTLPHGLPFGEDAFAGVDFRVAGYRLLQDNHNVVETFCPRQLLPSLWSRGRTQGFGASSIWKQRVMRWYLSWPRRLPSELALTLFYDAGSWGGNLRYRLDFVWYCIVMCVSSLWFLYVVYIAVHGTSLVSFGILHAALSLTSLTTSVFRWCVFPANLRQGLPLTTALMMPLMNVTVCLLMCCSLLVSLLWYIPFKRIDYRRCFLLAE